MGPARRDRVHDAALGFAKTYDSIALLFDAFCGEGAWQREYAAPLGEQLDLDVRKEVVAALAGRVSLVSWVERPVRVNSRAALFGLKLKSADRFTACWTVWQGDSPGNLSGIATANTRFTALPKVRPPTGGVDERTIRLPEYCLSVLGDYLVISDSVGLLKEACNTQHDESAGLANELDFKLVANKIMRQLGGPNAGMFSFERPEEEMRMFYELAASEATRGLLATRAESNPLARTLNESLQQHPLPPFCDCQISCTGRISADRRRNRDPLHGLHTAQRLTDAPSEQVPGRTVLPLSPFPTSPRAGHLSPMCPAWYHILVAVDRLDTQFRAWKTTMMHLSRSLSVGLWVVLGMWLSREMPHGTAAEPADLCIGVAETDITPPEGFPMAGYYHEQRADRDARSAQGQGICVPEARRIAARAGGL